MDAIPHLLQPSYELDGPGFGQKGQYDPPEAGFAGVHGFGGRIINTPGSSFQNVYIMDLSIAVWDETDRKFHRVPSLHAVYFAPIPKAVLIRMTVCDINKKGRISYSRVIRLPSGTGNGHFDPAVVDTGAAAKALALKIKTLYPAEAVDLTTQQLTSAADSSGGTKNHKADLEELVLNYHSLPLPLNRLKQLRTPGNASATDLDPVFIDATVFKP
jgi:hypothetical protein